MADDRGRQRERGALRRAAELRFRVMIDNITDYAIFTLDVDGFINSWNAGAQKIKGYEDSEILGRHFSIYYTPEDIAAGKPERELAAAANTGRYAEEGWRVRKDGSRFWASIAISAVRDERGVLLGYAKVTRDLTRQREAEQALRRSEEQYRLLLDGVADGVVSIDERGTVHSFSPAAERMFGYAATEVIGHNVTMLIPQRFHAGHGAHVARFARQEDPRLIGLRREVVGRRRDGAEFPVMLALNVAQGEGAPRFVALVTDLSEQKLAEQALRRSEEQYRLLVDGVADGVVSIDERGTVHSFSPAAERMFGYAATEVIGHNVTMLIPQRFHAGHGAHVARFARQEDPRLIGLRREVVGRRRDGAEFPVMLALNVAQGEGAPRFVALVTDLSEQKRAEQAIAEAHRRVRSMIDSAPFSIITSDQNGVTDSFNPAAERLTKYARDEMLGKPLQVLHLSEEIAARAEQLSRAHLDSVAPGFDTFTFLAKRGVTDEHEWTYVCKDGSQVPVQVVMSAMRDPEDRSVIGYMGIAYDVSERKRREEYTRYIANHDHLTGLPTRNLLDDRLQMALARSRRARVKAGVLLLDLDHFKRINDSLGHHIGDELLCKIAERLRASVRESDTVARLGGDEFVVVLPEIAVAADVERVAKEIVRRVSAPIKIADQELHVTPSIGIALYPDNGDDPQELMKHADVAMYQAKRGGRRGWRVFKPEMHRAASDRLAIENALRQAIEHQELKLHYQPLVGLCSGRVNGMEALLRWTHLTRGPISPAEFVPIAEECGLIGPLGDWVLRTACREARALQGATGTALRVSVNLSAHQFMQRNLVDQIADSLRDSGLPPHCLELEITEGTLIEQTGLAIAQMKAIRVLGVDIAIDDFGTGFSSLAYITRFPISTLKIDRSFVSKLTDSAGDAAVVQTIVALAHNLDARVIAEGVETAEQLRFLRTRYCGASRGVLPGTALGNERFSVQGWYFGKACSAEDFARDFERFSKPDLAMSGPARKK